MKKGCRYQRYLDGPPFLQQPKPRRCVIAFVLPSYTVSGGVVRPVYFYTVDMSEFAVSKLADRGSLTARLILTNVQDFVVTAERGLSKRCA